MNDNYPPDQGARWTAEYMANEYRNDAANMKYKYTVRQGSGKS